MDVREIVINELKKQTGRSDIEGSMNLFDDLSLSSLEAMELISNIETKIKIEIDEEILGDIATVDDLILGIQKCVV